MDSSHETIDVRQDGRRVFVTLDRPEVLNAQNEAFLRDFLDVTAGLAGRDDFDAVAVRSSCDHWGAGLDLKAAAEGWRLTAKTVEWWETALRHLETIKQLVVALIDGYCLGGGLQLALACDLRSEIADTDNRDYRRGLIARRDRLRALLDQVGGPVVRTP